MNLSSDENGVVKTRYNYTPFGEPEIITITSDKSSEAEIAEALEKLPNLEKDVIMELLKSAAYFSRYYSELYGRELKSYYSEVNRRSNR